MNSLSTLFFGPLDKNSCVYFLLISVIFFISLVILILNELYYIAKNYDKLSIKLISSSVIILFNVFIAYFVNRLLYTMCSQSLH